jgi:hypothetical protein
LVIPLRVEAEEGKVDSQVVECLAALVEKGEGIERDLSASLGFLVM